MKKILKRTVIVLICMTGLFFSLLVLQRPWIEPVERKVRLQPSRPILSAEDIKPGSAYDLLQKACDFTPPTGEFPYDSLQRLSTNTWSDTTFSNLVTVLEVSRTNMVMLRRAIEAPHPQVPTITNFNYHVSMLGEIRQIVRLSAISACHKAFYGDYEGAYEDLLSGIRAGKILTRGGTLIHHLVAFACSDIGCRWMIILSDRHTIPSHVLKRSARALLEIDAGTEPLAEAFRHEWLFMLASLGEILPKQDMLGLAAHNDLSCRLALFFAPLLGSNSDTTRRNLRRYHQHLIKHVTEPVDLAGLRVFYQSSPWPCSWEILFYRDPVGLVLAGSMSGAWDRAAEKYLYHRKQLRITAAYLAVQAYRQEKNSMPESLDQLVPGYLQSVPFDPYDREFMQYTNIMATVSATLSAD